MENGFAKDLAWLGPDGERPVFTRSQAQTYCRRLATTHYENFSVASLLLPRRLLPHFHAIYAYCRWADDLGDETGGGERALGLLQWWREELLRCYKGGLAHQVTRPVTRLGAPGHPGMIALQRTIRRFAIPAEPFLNLLHAFEQDQRVRRYDTYAQLVDYCRYSANPVGRLVLYLCECFDERRAALSDHVCTALQLANFWQDVSRDLDIGRVYLPAEDRRRFGYDDADLETRRMTPAFRELMQLEVARARDLFHAGLPLVALVPEDVRTDIELFIRGGLGILDKIVAIDYNVWRERPVLRKRDKAALLGGVLWRRTLKALW